MTAAEAKKQIEDLTTKINYHNHLYYQESKSEISDRDFDMLLKKLEQLEKDFPQHRLPDSPTQRVGGTITKEFESDSNSFVMVPPTR